MTNIRKQRGVTLSGLIAACAVLGTVALIGMKLFPLYNEKFKVDSALENMAAQPGSGSFSKTQVVAAIMKNFDVSDVDRFDTPALDKVVTVEQIRGTQDKLVNLKYEIRGPFFGAMDIVLKYDNTVTLSNSRGGD